MTKAEEAVLRAMHERGEATRPQLASATGLSVVSTGKAIASLCRRGEVRQVGEVPSGGGRPVQLYRYNAGYALHALVHIEKNGTLLHCCLELLDLHGTLRHRREADYAYLEQESLDGMLSEALRGRKLRSITLLLPPESEPPGIRAHLEACFGCYVQTPSPAMLLAHTETEGCATICLPQGLPPSCCICRHGHAQECGPLHLLPLPADWATLDYSDSHLVEEVVARLLVIITCTLAPERIKLHTPPFSSRLTERIRYNAATKLRGQLPLLTYHPLQPDSLTHQARAWCCALPPVPVRLHP